MRWRISASRKNNWCLHAKVKKKKSQSVFQENYLSYRNIFYLKWEKKKKSPCKESILREQWRKNIWKQAEKLCGKKWSERIDYFKEGPLEPGSVSLLCSNDLVVSYYLMKAWTRKSHSHRRLHCGCWSLPTFPFCITCSSLDQGEVSHQSFSWVNVPRANT